MTPPTDSAQETRALALARAALLRPGAPFAGMPERLLVVDVEHQRLMLLISGRLVASYPVSTAAAGIGGEDGSLRTPPGWHCIRDRIGPGAPDGTVFESRVPTGRRWGGEPVADDLILTRILTLDGLEDGINRGPGHDSLARYIYIHGTNHEEALGRPASHGCVRMAGAHVVDLFERVEAGDPVVIVEHEEAPRA